MALPNELRDDVARPEPKAVQADAGAAIIAPQTAVAPQDAVDGVAATPASAAKSALFRDVLAAY